MFSVSKFHPLSWFNNPNNTIVKLWTLVVCDILASYFLFQNTYSFAVRNHFPKPRKTLENVLCCFIFSASEDRQEGNISQLHDNKHLKNLKCRLLHLRSYLFVIWEESGTIDCICVQWRGIILSILNVFRSKNYTSRSTILSVVVGYKIKLIAIILFITLSSKACFLIKT